MFICVNPKFILNVCMLWTFRALRNTSLLSESLKVCSCMNEFSRYRTGSRAATQTFLHHVTLLYFTGHTAHTQQNKSHRLWRRRQGQKTGPYLRWGRSPRLHLCCVQGPRAQATRSRAVSVDQYDIRVSERVEHRWSTQRNR